jgi:bifunctional lysine-specific demethylase and histidyl-hydroxylase NO66
LRNQPWTDRRAAVEAAAHTQPIIDAVLRPGDCLYLPRGYLHSAMALGAVSIHLTIGVHPWTRYALAEEISQLVLERLAADPEIRQCLPLGVDLHDAGTLRETERLVAERMTAAVGSVDVASVLRGMTKRVRDAQRAAPVGPLSQLRSAQALDEETWVRVRRHLEPDLQVAGDGGLLVSRAGSIDLSALESESVRRLLEAGSARAGELGIDLARRLMSAGVLVAS